MSSNLETRKKKSWQIFDQIASSYDFLNRLLSFGIDIYWRNQLLKALPSTPEKGLKALDLATGTGDVALTLAKSERIEHIMALDLSKEMINIGRKKIVKKGLDSKITFNIGDGCNLPVSDDSHHLSTVSFGIRNFPSTQKGLDEMYRVLKKDGKALILEFSIPSNPLIKNLYFFYFRNILPFFGNLLSGHKDAYTYLNKTVEDYPHGQTFAELMANSGFKNISYKPLTFGIATLYQGTKC